MVHCGSSKSGGKTSSGGTAGTGTGGTGGGAAGSGGTAGMGGSGGGDASAGSGGVSGSGGTAGSGGADGGADAAAACAKYANTSADTACTNAATAICDLLFKCAPAEVAFTSKTECVTREKLGCTNALAAPGEEVQPADISIFADNLNALSCQDLFEDKVTQLGMNYVLCGGKPTLANGSGCFDDGQCKSSHCDIPSGSACGTCKALGGNGASCQFDSDCQSDNCSSGACGAPLPTAGQSCTSSGNCASGLYCDSNNKCQALRQLGQSCTSSADNCATGLECNSSQVCAVPPLADVGASCDPTDPLSCNLYKGIECDPSTNKCVQQQTAGAGQACGVITNDGSFSYVQCAPGTSCVTPQSSSQDECVTDAQDGQACDDTAGPFCIQPAVCAGGVCTVPSGTTCPAT